MATEEGKKETVIHYVEYEWQHRIIVIPESLAVWIDSVKTVLSNRTDDDWPTKLKECLEKWRAL